MDNAYNIYVDSALRSSGTNSDFTFQTTPNKYIQSKAKVAVASINWTNVIYQINNTNDTLNFSVTTAGPTTNFYTYTILDGNHTATELLTLVRGAMNTLTTALNTSIPMPITSVITNKISFRKYTVGEPNAPAGEVNATYTLLSTSTMKSVLGFESNVTFGNAWVELPLMANFRPIDYFYLTSPNVQSSSYAANIGGNGVLAQINILPNRNTVQLYENDNINDTLLDCSYIPMQWSFRLVDKFGQPITLGVPFSFTLRIIPE